MPKPYPKEFRDDVVAVARTGHTPINQIAETSGSPKPAFTTGLGGSARSKSAINRSCFILPKS